MTILLFGWPAISMPRAARASRHVRSAADARWPAAAAAVAVLFIVPAIISFVNNRALVKTTSEISDEAKAIAWSPQGGGNAIENVGKLDLAWTFRSGRGDVGIDQNTPLQIGDTIYSCTTQNVVIALDPDTGTEKWRYDPQAKGPFWQRCRGIG